MKPFDLTRKAQDDLREIAIYTEVNWGVKQRNVYIRQFDEIFHLLAATPDMGKKCDEIIAGYRKFPKESHVIFYKPGTTCAIEIVRILHKNMDVSPSLLGV
jgi:toxin ParE1/3/4